MSIIIDNSLFQNGPLQEYSTKQLQSLVVIGVGSRINKRSRQRLLTIIDDIEKRK